MGHTHWLLPHVAPLPHCQVPHHPPSLTNPLPALTSHTRLPPPSVGGRPCTSQGEGSSWSPWGWTEPHQPAATHQQPQQPVTHIHSSSSTRHAVPTEEVRACVIECVLAAQLQLAFQLHHLAVGQSAAACSRSRHTHPVCGHTTSAAAPGPKPPYTPPPPTTPTPTHLFGLCLCLGLGLLVGIACVAHRLSLGSLGSSLGFLRLLLSQLGSLEWGGGEGVKGSTGEQGV